MKVLIVPMSAMAETHGTVSRCRLITEGLMKAGIDVATCMAKDVNFRVIIGVKNYDLDVPMPLGLPSFIASKTFPVAQKLGITSRKAVRSFDDVLFITGNLDQGYLKRSVEQIIRAIEDFSPDLVYSEFNISAIIAAHLMGVRLFTTVSFPTQYQYAHNSGVSKGLNKLLKELSLEQTDSALKLFDHAECSFCPSIYELEPIDKPNVHFIGSLKKPDVINKERNKILVYMGNGTISPNRMLETVKGAFKDTGYEVYIASAALKEHTDGNLHIAPRWDFDSLLDESLLFLNHGGQNSVADGLIHGVPEICVPGRVFERIYNADSLVRNKAGISLRPEEFDAENLRKAFNTMTGSPKYADNAAALGKKLLSVGGIENIVDVIKRG